MSAETETQQRRLNILGDDEFKAILVDRILHMKIVVISFHSPSPKKSCCKDYIQ